MSSVEELVKRYGEKRMYGWFSYYDEFPKDLDLFFLTHTLEQQGFEIELKNEKLPFTLDDLCNYWQELKASNSPIIKSFVQNEWSKMRGFGDKFDQSIQKAHNGIYELRHGDQIKSGAKGLRLFRALLKNAWTMKHGQFVDLSSMSPRPVVHGSFLEFLKAKTTDYLRFQLRLQDDQARAAMEEFPHFTSLPDEEFRPKSYARFLENKIVNAMAGYEESGTLRADKAFDEVGLNTASYALRDIAVEGGEQVLRGTEFCFKVDSNARNYVLKKRLFYCSVKLETADGAPTRLYR